MIQVDISNIWGRLSLPDFLAMEQEVADAHSALFGAAGACGPDLAVTEVNEEHRRILEAARRIREQSDVCVVIGGASAGAEGVLELLLGPNRNLTGETPQIFFIGDSLSTRQWNTLMERLEDKDISLITVTGSSMESALAFRGLHWMLERKYGTDEADRRIYAVAGCGNDAMSRMAKEEGWMCFSVPAGTAEGFGMLTAAGLLPMAVAGLDIEAFLLGAAQTKELCGEPSLENPAWQYVAVRNMMRQSGRNVELLASFEPDFRSLGSWWRHLFAGSGGKGIFPAAAEFPADLSGPEMMIREGQENFFETLVRFDPPEQKYTIGSHWKDPEELNYLEGKTLDYVQERAFQAALDAHVDGGVPVITVDCGKTDERTVGSLCFFFALSSALSACIPGGNPFPEHDTRDYMRNLSALLGKPGCGQ